ncbi:DUF6907 domain-containing protein [Streptomyces sp. HUAS TT7]|uniref:DUF6907 domain-containing protein n=1 Tax=Streptomyces sp. HUAS TT7 TaxID=3447507 RepID=UPI003F65AA24
MISSSKLCGQGISLHNAPRIPGRACAKDRKPASWIWRLNIIPATALPLSFSCPPWCDWTHGPDDPGVQTTDDMVHILLGPGLAVERYGSKGWLEWILSLTAQSHPDRTPGSAGIEIDVAGGNAGKVSTRAEAERFAGQLRGMAAVVETWSAWLPDVPAD